MSSPNSTFPFGSGLFSIMGLPKETAQLGSGTTIASYFLQKNPSYQITPQSSLSRATFALYRAFDEFLAEGAVTKQDVNGQLFEFVFVRRLFPGEILRVFVEDELQQLNGHVETAELVTVGHVNLSTTANLASTLVERGLEVVFTEVDARQFEAVHVLA